MSSHFVTVFPQAQRLRLPLTRDQLVLLIAAISELFTGFDTLLAHSISGSLTRNEWIPVIFGTGAGILLLLAGLLAFRHRALATILANTVFLASIVVGLLGTYFHLERAGIIGSTVAQGRTVNALIWAPPFLGLLCVDRCAGDQRGVDRIPCRQRAAALAGEPARANALQQNTRLFSHCRHLCPVYDHQQCARPFPAQP